mmetsp:Transcript_38007/g.98124  ORF Transcript_38007/g.98124 Transcript_38007/m.98124 type:complete len:343 (-) Transcript_38007:412-1440(-)|eukprot:CAMPEP_0113877850 /NCGR_PEP_ID=MMETSP0780_2-20120614/6338_1 /TAXON_ID=652834 /ORGANISM="Palpitomonas bilix" /LENGTH=342 /DNA_ID=CAMNT_0000864219 /DNA_START=29 /DNA_END=1057 /DNA_ORIENTATION=+ /assembly_acc=CAM_ASM_000599
MASTFITQRANVSIRDGVEPDTKRGEPLPITHTSQCTELLKAQKELEKVQEQLNKEKENFKERMDAFKRDEDRLREKQEELRKNVTRFAKFMKENEAKRKRAEKKAQDEQKQRQQKDEEILNLKTMKHDFEEKRTKMITSLDEIMVYKEYLELVHEVSEDFQEVSDILMRYETLTAAERDLTKDVEKRNAQIEALRQELNNFTKTTQNEILVLNSEIAASQKLLEEKKISASSSEQSLHRVETERKEKIRTLGEIRMAIGNLFDRCVKGSKRPAEAKKGGNLLATGGSGAENVSGAPGTVVGAKSEPERLRIALRTIGERMVDLKSIVQARDSASKAKIPRS